MRSKRTIRNLILLLSIICIFGVMPVTAAAAVDGEAVVTGKCTACHSGDRIKNASKTSGEWAVLVDQEIDRGAQLNGEERSAVIKYLAANFSSGSAQQTDVAQTAATSGVAAQTSQATPAQQARTGVEMWQFIIAGSSFIGTGLFLRRKK